NLRLELESAGVRLCVAGARTDVYPSGMSRESGLAQVAYILYRHRFIWRMPILRRYGRRLKPVDIFSSTPCNLVGSVSEQRAYFERWVEGIF
ncbi:MAG TPA: hypothetical protein VF940_03955, partial [Streptosporangiaceae bacterium]